MGSTNKTYRIGVSGPSCGGKSTVCQHIVDQFKSKRVIVLSQDRYYKGGNNETNYDEPDALYFSEMIDDIKKLISGQEIWAPVYDFSTDSRKPEKQHIKRAPIIIVEGIL